MDGVKRVVKFEAKEDGSIIIRAPFFWYNLILDPNFSFLFRDPSNGISSPPPECSPLIKKKNKKWYQKWQMYLSIPIGLFLILAGVALFKYHRIVYWWKSKYSTPTLQIEMDD